MMIYSHGIERTRPRKGSAPLRRSTWESTRGLQSFQDFFKWTHMATVDILLVC